MRFNYKAFKGGYHQFEAAGYPLVYFGKAAFVEGKVPAFVEIQAAFAAPGTGGSKKQLTPEQHAAAVDKARKSLEKQQARLKALAAIAPVAPAPRTRKPRAEKPAPAPAPAPAENAPAVGQ